MDDPILQEKRTVLVADDERELVSDIRKRLLDRGYEVCTASDGYEALSKARTHMPDLILLDIMLRGLQGPEIQSRLNQEEATANIPIIFMTPDHKDPPEFKNILLQADDCARKPIQYDSLLTRVDALSTRRKKYEHIFLSDALTGLSNRHIFKKNFKAFFDVAKRYGRVFSLAVIDINDFKMINDKYGHAAGDEVLRSLAAIMKKIFRAPDLLIRYGGDEFVILLPETNEAQAKESLERLRIAIAQTPVVHKEKDTKSSFHFSISAGVAAFSPKHASEDIIFELADANMYKDKKRQKKLSLK